MTRYHVTTIQSNPSHGCHNDRKSLCHHPPPLSPLIIGIKSRLHRKHNVGFYGPYLKNPLLWFSLAHGKELALLARWVGKGTETWKHMLKKMYTHIRTPIISHMPLWIQRHAYNCPRTGARAHKSGPGMHASKKRAFMKNHGCHVSKSTHSCTPTYTIHIQHIDISADMQEDGPTTPTLWQCSNKPQTELLNHNTRNFLQTIKQISKKMSK